jgi:metalloendopeptidase OMA1, mitochondrial
MKRDIIQRAFDHLAPGGYLECQELSPFLFCDDKTMRKSFAPRKLFNLLVETSHEADRPLDIAEHLTGWLREVGFVEVHEEIFQVPINGWPKDKVQRDIGRCWQTNLSSGLPAFSLALLHRFRGLSAEEVQVSDFSSNNEISQNCTDRVVM